MARDRREVRGMKTKILLIVILALGMMSCEPFMVSPFPGFLPDLDAAADVSGYFPASDVEHYELCALNNGTEEYVFLQAQLYSGDRRIVIFNTALQNIFAETSDQLGGRHMVDVSGLFIIGNRLYDMTAFPPGAVPISAGDPYMFGCVINNTNVILSSSGVDVMFSEYTAAWAPNGLLFATPKAIVPGGVPGYFDLAYSRWFPTMDLSLLHSASIGGAVLVFRKSNPDEPDTGYAVIIDQDAYIDVSQPLITGDPHCHTVLLGSLGWDDVWVAPPGIVNRAKDGTYKLRLWDGTLAAETRNITTSGELLMDYGWQGYYYIFDPGSKKLFKARYWWEK
jgi:hypothetical protein